VRLRASQLKISSPTEALTREIEAPRPCLSRQSGTGRLPVVQRLKFDQVTETVLPCSRTEGKRSQKKAQEIEQKSKLPVYLLNPNEILATDEVI